MDEFLLNNIQYFKLYIFWYSFCLYTSVQCFDACQNPRLAKNLFYRNQNLIQFPARRKMFLSDNNICYPTKIAKYRVSYILNRIIKHIFQ